MGSIANSKTQEMLNQLGLTLDRFPYGTSIPVVYVRYIAEVDLFYIGQSRDLRHRYGTACLSQVMYIEVISDPVKRLRREQELVSEFEEAGLPLARRSGQHDHVAS